MVHPVLHGAEQWVGAMNGLATQGPEQGHAEWRAAVNRQGVEQGVHCPCRKPPAGDLPAVPAGPHAQQQGRDQGRGQAVGEAVVERFGSPIRSPGRKSALGRMAASITGVTNRHPMRSVFRRLSRQSEAPVAIWSNGEGMGVSSYGSSLGARTGRDASDRSGRVSAPASGGIVRLPTAVIRRIL